MKLELPKTLFTSFKLGFGLVGCLAFTLSACTNSGERAATAQGLSNSSDWEAVCLGHLILDLPKETVIGATHTKIGAPAKFEGIGGGGDFWGKLRYDSMEVAETYPNTIEGFEPLIAQAVGKVVTPKELTLEIKAMREEVREWEEIVARSNSDVQRSILRKKRAAIDDFVLATRVSGVAKLNDPNAFAVREHKNFVVGFRDAADSRIRFFTGELSSLEPLSPKAAAIELDQLRKKYQARAPSKIPSSPGFCTAFGFINEPSGPAGAFEFRVPFQLKQYPNLLFYLEMAPGEPVEPRDSKGIFNKNSVYAMMTPSGAKKRHGPSSVRILGMHGTKIAREYGPICSKEGDCTPADRAYDFQAELPGEEGRADRPRLTLHMSALHANVPEKSTTQEKSGVWRSKADLGSPALKGHTPPSFEVGREIFEHVLNSIRVRPGAFANNEKSALRKINTSPSATGGNLVQGPSQPSMIGC